MLVRKKLEEQEKKILAPYASFSSLSKGRELPEEKCPLRTDFQKDRDKIIHCQAFRRLKHKTQVFISPAEDYYRTRLTHTLEVAQVARTISRALSLNEDLTEAIALGHDLGHTPFGHSGEDVIDDLLKKLGKKGFKHSEQSLRVAKHLEHKGQGLNLCAEVLDGILHHPQKDPIHPKTLEGQVVRLADHIAYINHDLQDSIRAGILKKNEIPQRAIKVLGRNIIDSLVRSVVSASLGKPQIVMHKTQKDAMDAIYNFLYERVYTNPEAKTEEGKTNHILRALFNYYLENKKALPKYQKKWDRDTLILKITDFIAGMTDRYAINKYVELFVPNDFHSQNVLI